MQPPSQQQCCEEQQEQQGHNVSCSPLQAEPATGTACVWYIAAVLKQTLAAVSLLHLTLVLVSVTSHNNSMSCLQVTGPQPLCCACDFIHDGRGERQHRV